MEQTLTEKRDQGFTLIELLIAIVVVGVLSAVAIVGISSLVNSGETAACQASSDAAQAAGAVYYANNSGSTPTNLEAMVGDELRLPTGVTVAGNLMSAGTNWSRTYVPATNTWTGPCL